MKIRNADGSTDDVSDERGQELVNLGAAQAVGDVPTIEKPSKAVSEQEVRWEQASSEYATPQEKRQAATEQAYLKASDNQPRRHETIVPTLHVPDESHTAEARKQVAESEESLGFKTSVKTGGDSATKSAATKGVPSKGDTSAQASAKQPESQSK